MLTRLRIRNFKRFDEADIELGNTVILIGPNNSGKTTALQSLALWNIGLRKWNEKRYGKSSPEKRSGVTINRNDLISIPTPYSNLLWRKLHVRNTEKINGTQQVQNIRIDIIVDGITNGKSWSCGLEFDYANEESFYCRPLRIGNGKTSERMPIPECASDIKIGFLPPMSGLAAVEPKWEQGRISVLLGEGQTAQVLRNLCYQIYERDVESSDWQELCNSIKKFFGITLLPPLYIKERGEMTMSYKDIDGTKFDISSSGRGLQQTLLLLAHLYVNPQSVLLLDEPDAHLEILRQRQTYKLITEVAQKQNSQIIAASHSEVVLNEAAEKDIVIAFVGTPHRINDRGSQVLKSLKDIGFEHYYQAEQTGWVLYLEGSTDLSILQALASKLKHKAGSLLECPFVHYIANQPQKTREHFWGLKEAKKDLVGIAIFDHLEKESLHKDVFLIETMWEKREIENYICTEDVLIAYAKREQPDDLFGAAEAEHREKIMKEAIEEVTVALKTLGKGSPWSAEIKVSDNFIEPLFEKYFEKMELPNIMRKSNYSVLAQLIAVEEISSEIIEKLDLIVEVCEKTSIRL